MKRPLTNTQKLIILVIIILGLSCIFSMGIFVNLFRGKIGNGREQTITLKNDFSNIEIRSKTSDIRFYRSGERNGKISWSGSNSMKLSVETRHGKLTIREKYRKPWFLRIGLNLQPSEIRIFLPEKSYKELEIESDTGRVTIPADFSFTDTRIETDTGAVNFQARSAKSLKIETDTGSINISGLTAEDLSVKSDTGSITLEDSIIGKDLRVETDTGRITLKKITCEDLNAESDTGAITLSNVLAADEMEIDNDTGSVSLDRCDASSVSIKTDTGAIRGTLLSDKVFTAKSGTGHVSVPDTNRGGSCVLRSGTGSIEISIQKR